MAYGESVSVPLGKPRQLERELDALAKAARRVRKEAREAERAQAKAGLQRFRRGKSLSIEEARLVSKHAKKDLTNEDKKILRKIVQGEAQHLGLLRARDKVARIERTAMAFRSAGGALATAAAGNIGGVFELAQSALGSRAMTKIFGARFGRRMQELGVGLGQALGIAGIGVAVGAGAGAVMRRVLESRREAARARGMMFEDSALQRARFGGDVALAGTLAGAQIQRQWLARLEASALRGPLQRLKDVVLPGEKEKEAARVEARKRAVEAGLRTLYGRLDTAGEIQQARNRAVIVRDVHRREAARDLAENNPILQARAKMRIASKGLPFGLAGAAYYMFTQKGLSKAEEDEAREFYGEAAVERAAEKYAEEEFLRSLKGLKIREERATEVARDLRQSYYWHEEQRWNIFRENLFRPKAAAVNRD